MNCVCCNSLDSKKIFNKEGFDYFKCLNCGFVFIQPVPKNLEQVYTKEYFTGGQAGFGYVDYDKDKEPMKPTYIKYFQ